MGRSASGQVVPVNETAAPRELLCHVVLGDHLALNEGGTPVWYSPLPANLTRWAGLSLLAPYRGLNGSQIEVDLGHSPEWLAEALPRWRHCATPAAAHTKWAYFYDRLGRFGDFSNEEPICVDCRLPPALPFVAARRVAHPNALIDRLMVRDREEALTEFRMLMSGALADSGASIRLAPSSRGKASLGSVSPNFTAC